MSGVATPDRSAEAPPLHLFEGFGIEIEYMIVGREDLAVRPLCDELLRKLTGRYDSEVERGELAWSNEIGLHLVELKTNGPAARLEPLADLFQRDVRHIDELLSGFGARLMPGAMHPFMIGKLTVGSNDWLYRSIGLAAIALIGVVVIARK